MRASIVACCAVTKLTNAEPTLPHPSTPIRTSLVTGGRLRGGVLQPKPFVPGQGRGVSELRPGRVLRRLSREAIDPLQTRIVAITKPPLPVPVWGSWAELVVGVEAGFGTSEAFSGLAGGARAGTSGAESTQAWC